MEKIKTSITIDPEALEFLRTMGGSPRKISVSIEQLVADEAKRQNLTEGEIYRQIAVLTEKLSELKDK